MPEDAGETSPITPGKEEEAEPWESWETKLVLWSIGIGMIVLVIGGLLINHFILG